MDEREKKRLTRRAMLGDREAAKLLTEAGVLVPCPFCGEKIIGKEIYADRCVYSCGRRAPILSAREIEMLEGME